MVFLLRSRSTVVTTSILFVISFFTEVNMSLGKFYDYFSYMKG